MILNTDEIEYIYVATTYVDMRKSIDGLAAIVTLQFRIEVMNNSLFIFTNKNRNRLKLLYYADHGFWLFIRRLNKGTFKIHEKNDIEIETITPKQLEWLVNGLETTESKMMEKQGKWLNM